MKKMSIEELLELLEEINEVAEFEGVVVLDHDHMNETMQESKLSKDEDNEDEHTILIPKDVQDLLSEFTSNTNKKEKKCCKCNGQKSDINHPDHYKAGDYECIDVMEKVFGIDLVIDFCLGNAFKYLFRCSKKGRHEDILKAGWYLNKYKEIATGGLDDNKE